MSAEAPHSNPTAVRVAISGASGLIGSHVAKVLRAAGHRVQDLVRRAPRPASDDVRWDPATGEVDAAALAGVETVIHLAGESIAAGRWTAARKAAIRESRVGATQRLCMTLAQLDPRPRRLLSASAIGYYGDRGDEVLTEDSAAGTGFLADVCREWEAATEPAEQAGIRVVHLRTGMVLAAEGGALAKMLGPFRSGVGGKVASGRQYMSWITLADVGRVVQFLLQRDDIVGSVNVVGPSPVTNAVFTETLGHVLARPALMAVPAVAVRLLFGEMGTELLLGSVRAVPQKLQAAGFAYRHSELAAALREVVARVTG